MMDFKVGLEHALDLTNTTLGTIAMARTTKVEIVINGHVKAVKGITKRKSESTTPGKCRLSIISVEWSSI